MPQLNQDRYVRLSKPFTYAQDDGLFWDKTDSELLLIIGNTEVFSIDASGVITAGSLEAADLLISGQTQGDLLRYSGSAWERLAAATSGNILCGDGSDVISAALSGDATISAAGALTIAASAITAAKAADSAGASGQYVAKYALALYDFATDGGGSPGAITLTDAATIPDNAVLELVSYDVLTTFTSATDAATVKLGVVTDGDASTAIAINDGGNPFDSGAHLGSELTPIALKTTADRLVTLTSAVEALTAGKAVFCFRYWVSA